MTGQPQHPQQELSQRECIIDLEKFDKKIEGYISKETFCTFSKTDLRDTLDEIRTIVYNCVERRECASHSSAQQQRIKQVIRELEKEKDDAISRYTNATTMNEEVYQQGIVFAYQHTIALLQAGDRQPQGDERG